MAAPTLTLGETLGHFRLIELIGTGGMGIVYRARDERLLRNVAVKVLNPKTLADASASQRFRHEALILGRLNHPNVEAVYDFHSERGLEYLVIEYVPGTSLDDRLQHGALPEKEVILLAVQLAHGLAAAHAQGIIHRDLKPGNLRVTPENVLKILDFGLAQLFAAPGALTETATVTMAAPGFAGTLAYMAPEQLEGQEPDTRSDVYSAGVVLYELATGSKPFPQRGQMLWEAILHSLPPAPRLKKADISPGLEAVILKCLEKDPKLRYQSANELLDGLSRLSAGQETTATNQLSRVEDLVAKTRKRRIIATLAAVLLLGLAVGYVAKRWWTPQTSVRQRVMAVLPIDTMGQDPSTSALGLGMTETLTTKLVQASDSDAIQVVSPRDLRDKGIKTAEDARREFGTDLVLESSIQRSGPTIRINCYLVDSRTHRQLAAKTIEAEIGDPFVLQDRVVSAALDMLPVQIKPEQHRKLNASQDTQPAAYEAYIRGRGYLQEYEKPENIDSAITEFNQALKVDPNYAPPYAGLGEAYWIGYQQLNRGKVWLAKASANCEKALDIAAGLAEGHTCLGNVLKATGQYAKAAEQFQRAVDLNPDSEEALRGLADSYQKRGNPSGAEAAYKKAIALRPNYWGAYNWLGAFYASQARYLEAADMFRKVTELTPDNYRGHSNLGGIYLLQGHYEDAIFESKRSITLRPNVDAYSNLGTAYFALRRFADAAENFQEGANLDERNWMNWGNLADALYWTPGRRPEASSAYRKAITLAQAELELNPRDATAWFLTASYCAMLDDKTQALDSLQRALEIAPADPEVAFRAAIVYNHFGDTERALSWLKKAVDAGFSRSSIRDLPDFDTLQGNPSFRALIAGK